MAVGCASAGFQRRAYPPAIDSGWKSPARAPGGLRQTCYLKPGFALCLPGAAAYAAAKGGLLTYTKGLAKELAPHGIRVNGIAPGIIATPYHERYSPPEVFERFIASIPLGRAGTSEDIADVIVFLASPAARYIIGETVEVNGGMLMD